MGFPRVGAFVYRAALVLYQQDTVCTLHMTGRSAETRVRRGTAIVIAALLVAIVVALIGQLVQAA